MKTIISGVLASVFFVTQTIAVSYAAGEPANVVSSLTEDVWYQMADAIEERGEYFQNIADMSGIEVADLEFQKVVTENLNNILSQASKSIEGMTEDQARVVLENIKSASQPEEVSSLLSDRAMTEKEKIQALYSQYRTENFTEQMQELKSSAFNVGYKKAFSDVASDLRSRAWDDSWDEMDYSWAIVIIGVIAFASVALPGSTAITVFIVCWFTELIIASRGWEKGFGRER